MFKYDGAETIVDIPKLSLLI
ncbi:Protein of unknown function [Leuconostoc citreum LBAE C11]|nr:Protein of unknown function [Leuconostoc citreum LBAE C11]